MANHLTNNQIEVANAKAGDILKWSTTLKKFVPTKSNTGNDYVVTTIADRDALISVLVSGEGVLVSDATGDSTVTTGYAYYKWDGLKFIKIAEGESLDINIKMKDDAYDYDVWNLDNLGGASRHATANKIKELEDTLLELSPAKAPSLTGKDLYVNAAYSGYLPSGLASQWYPDSLVPGNQIQNVVRTSANYVFTIPEFRSGVKNKPDKYGALKASFASKNASLHLLPNTLQLSDNIAQTLLGDNVYAQGNVAPHNNFWAHANINLSLQDNSLTGYIKLQVNHTEAGTSNITRFFLDDSTEAVYNDLGGKLVGVTIQNKVSKYLSGREFLGFNTTLNVSYNLSNLFERLYLKVDNTTIDCVAATKVSVSPQNIPAFTDNFVITNKAVILDIPNQYSNTPQLVVNANKPGHTVNSKMVNLLSVLSYKVNTYGIVSTKTEEYFQDEDKRLNAGTNIKFNSTTALPEGEAQVSSGILRFNVDYTKVSAIQRFDRKFTSTTNYSSGSFNIGSFDTNNIAPYGTGSVNIILYLDGTPLNNKRFFDMGIPFGQGGDGSTMANAIGCKVNNNGNVINFTFGTYSTAYSNNEYLTTILFRDNTQVMTSIISS